MLKISICIALLLCFVLCFILYLAKRKNNRLYLFFLTAIFSFLIELSTFPLRGIKIEWNLPSGFPLCAVVTFVLYFIFINLMLAKHSTKLKPQWILIACLIGCCIIQLPLRMFLTRTLVSLPDFLFHLFGIFMGYLFYISGKYIKSGIAVTSILCCSFLYFKGYELWLNKLSYGTFSGIIQVKAEIPEFQFTDRDGNIITRQDFAGKYVVFDFWTTSCGICFRKFPKFEEQYVKYRSNENVVFYAVNVKLPRDKEGVSFEIISERGYSFPTLQSGQTEDAKSIFGIQAVPTIIILNPSGVMVYRGDIEGAFLFIEKELKKKQQ